MRIEWRNKAYHDVMSIADYWTLECARINLAYLTGESPVMEGSRSHHVASLGAP